MIALAVAIAKSLTKVRHNPDVSDDSGDGGSDGEDSDSDSDGTEFSDSDTAYSSDSEDSGDNGLCYEHWDETFVIEQEGAGKEEEE